ncbi:pentatricopeptide repeat-containing protein At1g31920-like [Primulina tabacum]|uniref:pentatricopeptide repeat-containing protein At1g31920-like n=1 Tax=Primulina tabacum TaxID=48773 RepID=UPI003F597012
MTYRHIQALFQQSTISIKALQLHCLLFKISLDHNEFFFSQLILASSSVYLHHARKLFDNSPITHPPLFAWNTLIKSYSNNSSTPLESLKLFVELLRSHGELKPDKFTYPFVIKACGRCLMIAAGGSVHSMVLKAGLGSDQHVNNTLLTMYGRCGVIGYSRKVFDEMIEKDVVSWSSMIAAYVDCNRTWDSLMVFKDIMMLNGKPNSVTLVSLITACTKLLNIRVGKSFHSYIIRNATELDVSLVTALLNMYSKYGLVEEAFHIFNYVGNKYVQSWTVMISCLAEYGHGKEALSLFTRMEKTGLLPDCMSFSAILSACSHNGLVHEASDLFEKMVNVYGISPTLEHYGCMVDLLGRAGKIEEAYRMIMSMPMEPNSVILRSYLSSCKHHGHVHCADSHLMKLLLETEPEIGANYVLAGSVSSLQGYDNGINNIRNDMKQKGLKKVPGCSWVQLPVGDHAGFCIDI